MKKHYVLLLICIMGSITHTFSQSESRTFLITDFGERGTGSTTWTSNNEYIIDSTVYVNPGDTLTIEAGTVVRGRYARNGAGTAILVVSRGAKIFAEGTPENPIIFTSEGDNLSTIGDSPCLNAEVTYLSDSTIRDRFLTLTSDSGP